MKVRNIVFSGFAAAILMGTANAAVPFQIASKAYVDPAADGQYIRTANTTGANLTALDSAIRDAAASADTIGDMDDLNDENTNFGENTDTVVEALNDLDTALNAKQDKSASEVTTAGNHLTAGNGVGANLEALDTALGTAEGKIDSLEDAVNGDGTNPGLAEIVKGDPNDPTDNGLAGRVQTLEGTVGTGAMTVAGTTQADVIAAINALDAKTEGIATDANLQQLETAVGLKQNEADSNVATGTYNYISAGHDVKGNLVALDTGTKAAKDAADAAQADADTLDAQINGDPEDSTDNGLAGDVAALQDALNDQTNGLTPRVAALEDKVGDGQLSQDFGNGVETLTDAVNNLMANKLNSPIPNTCSANSLHCVLHMDSTGALSWVDVTAPFEVGE